VSFCADLTKTSIEALEGRISSRRFNTQQISSNPHPDSIKLN
jgi:hypothetical protein